MASFGTTATCPAHLRQLKMLWLITLKINNQPTINPLKTSNQKPATNN